MATLLLVYVHVVCTMCMSWAEVATTHSFMLLKFCWLHFLKRMSVFYIVPPGTAWTSPWLVRVVETLESCWEHDDDDDADDVLVLPCLLYDLIPESDSLREFSQAIRILITIIVIIINHRRPYDNEIQCFVRPDLRQAVGHPQKGSWISKGQEGKLFYGPYRSLFAHSAHVLW